MNIGLIGCGNIGRFLLNSININGLIPGRKIVSIYTRSQEVSQQIAMEYNTISCSTIEELLQSDVDLVVEAATIEVAQKYMLPIIESGRDLLLSSIGVLADPCLLEDIRRITIKHKTKVIVPTGAIGGLDLVKSANAMNTLDEVSLTTIKPPAALPDSKANAKISTLFEGTAAEAIKLFPRNINVAIALSLAGIGVERTRVKIMVDPQIERNTHIIEAVGSFGTCRFKIENDPMPNNPRTSYLAALSVLATLQNLETSIQIG